MLKSQEMRKLAPEMDPLRIGTGWKKEDLEKPQIMVESTYGDSHPGSGHLNLLVEEVRKGVAEAGGFGARYFCTDICDGESQGTDGINYSLASREMITNMIKCRHLRPHNFHTGKSMLLRLTNNRPHQHNPSATLQRIFFWRLDHQHIRTRCIRAQMRTRCSSIKDHASAFLP